MRCCDCATAAASARLFPPLFICLFIWFANLILLSALKRRKKYSGKNCCLFCCLFCRFAGQSTALSRLPAASGRRRRGDRLAFSLAAAVSSPLSAELARRRRSRRRPGVRAVPAASLGLLGRHRFVPLEWSCLSARVRVVFVFFERRRAGSFVFIKNTTIN